MTLSISDQIVCRQIESEEYISESNLFLSQTLQTFCKEATSCSAIFALATGQAIGLLAKAQSFKYFSLLCKTGSPRLSAYYASSAFGVIAEGISFPIATQLGKNEKLQIGSFGNNFHGILTLALCKTIGKKFPINNVVFQHLIQDCAMVSLDVTCEVFKIIEQKTSSVSERFLEAELASIRIEVSMKLLAFSCYDFSRMQAKRELGFEFEIGLKVKERKTDFIGLFDHLLSPDTLTSNGFLMKIPRERKTISRTFVMEAKDLQIMAVGTEVSANRLNGIRPAAYVEKSQTYLDLLPKTSQNRWREVRAENEKLATLLLETWDDLCAHPIYLKDVFDRGGLIDQYAIATEAYLSKTGKYSADQRHLLIEYGIEILFRKVSEDEFFHVEDRSLETPVVRTEEGEKVKFLKIGNRGKVVPYHRLKRELRAKEKIEVKEEKQKTLQDFEDLKRDHPQLAKWVQMSLASWSLILEGKHPIRIQELGRNSQNSFDTFEVNARTVLRNLVPSVSLEEIYDKILPLAFKFRHLHEEICSSSFGLRMSDYYSPFYIPKIHTSPMNAHQRFLPPKTEFLFENSSVELIDLQLLPLWLQKRLARQKRGVDPQSALYILGIAIVQSGKKLSELEDLVHTHFDDLLNLVEVDPTSRRPIDLEILVRLKTVFSDLSVPFDSGRFCRDLFPYAVKLFPTLAENFPRIVIDHDDWREAFSFDLGKRILTYRLDHQQVKSQLTYEQIAEKFSSSGVSIAPNAVQRYELNLVQVVEDRVFRSISESIGFTSKEEQIAYLASRPEFVQLVPVYIRTSENTFRTLTIDETKEFKRRRSRAINSIEYKRELAAALLRKGIKTEKEFADYLEKRGIKRSKAKKFLILGDYCSEREIEEITQSFDLSYSKWQRYFDHSLDSYFLGSDPEGNILYPKKTDFEKLLQIPPCSAQLLREKYPEINGWSELSLEQKWHLYIVQIILNKFGNNGEGAKKTGIAIVRSYKQFQLSILNRSWTNETIAQFSNTCKLTPDERALLYMYFRQKKLEKKI